MKHVEAIPTPPDDEFTDNEFNIIEGRVDRLNIPAAEARSSFVADRRAANAQSSPIVSTNHFPVVHAGSEQPQPSDPNQLDFPDSSPVTTPVDQLRVNRNGIELGDEVVKLVKTDFYVELPEALKDLIRDAIIEVISDYQLQRDSAEQ